MIQFQNINKHFGKFHVLKNIQLQLDKGNVVALIGPNACGKTTLIKSLLGMVLPDSGEIFFQNKSIQKDWAYRNHIGYMPQMARYPENMTVKQVIRMIEDLRSSLSVELDKELFERFELHKILDKRMGTLSGGTRQKVSAYLAFLFNPTILVLDEPTAGLDPVSSIILKEKIKKEKEKGKLILITSHILSELDEMVSRIIYMEDGNLIFNQSLEELQQSTQQTKLSEAIAKIMLENKTETL